MRRQARTWPRGVAQAPAQAVVHRDLTPNNVFLCDDRQVKILNFAP